MGTIVTEILQQSGGDPIGQWEQQRGADLRSRNTNMPVPPGDIVELEAGHFAYTQAVGSDE
jgi:hypothetical protein